MPYTLTEEGGYSNDAHDPGGMTMNGIIQREYDRWRAAKDLPTRWVREITPDEVHAIYFAWYWLPYSPLLPAGLDLCFFDTCVNNGLHAAIVLMQRMLGLEDDGLFGPKTKNAASLVYNANVNVVSDLIKLYCVKRGTYYRSLRNFVYFGNGWMKRNSHIEGAALRLVGTSYDL